MKHNSLISANGFHNPIAPETTKSSFLTSLFKPILLLFLLMVGSSAAWASTNYFTPGKTLYFHVGGDCKNWGSNQFAALFYYQNNENKAYGYENESYSARQFIGNNSIGSTNRIKCTRINDDYYSVVIPTNGTANIGYVRLIHLNTDDGWCHQAQKKISADSFTGTNNCLAYSAWDDGDPSGFEAYNSGECITSACGGAPASDTFQGGEVFYMKQNTICKDGNSHDFLKYGRCDFNLYSADGSSFLSKALSAQVIPGTDPVMLKFVVPAEYAGTVWGQVKVKQLETGGAGHNETNKGAIPKDGKNYLINGNTMEWGTYVEPVVPTTTYTVTLHPNNGGASTIVKENVPEGSNASAAALNLSAITYGVGTATWYTNSECTTPFSSVTSNMDLYAKWGVSGNYYVVGDLWMYDAGGNWDNNKGQLMTNTNGVCTVTYTAPEGLNRFEIIKDKDWGQKINGGNYSAVINASSPIPLSVSDGHIVFTLTEAKQVTITFDGKVSVSATDYSFNQTVDWRVKTSDSGWGNVPGSWDHSNVMTKTASGASIIIRNVPGSTNHSFMITRGSDEQALVGTYNFNALWLDTSSPSSGLTWNMQNTNIGDRQLAQTDNEWRNCSFRLSEQSDVRITFDGGVIRMDILPNYTISFDSKGGSTVASQTVSEGNTASEPADPTKAGYIFSKWQLNGSDYNFSNPVTGNITLDAVWEYKAISSISLSESAHTTWVGNTDFMLTYTPDPADGIVKSVAWNSNDESVATVSNGYVHAVAAGTARITCTVTDQFDTQKIATCEVTVAACEMTTNNLYSMTVTGYNTHSGDNADFAGLWNESTDNDGPASMTICNIRIGNDGTPQYAYDNNGTVMIESSSSNDVDKWYMIDAGTNLYYLKNISTGKYMYCGPTNTSGSKGNGWTSNGDWFLRSVYTSTSNGETDSYKFYKAKDDWNNDVIVSRADASMGTKATATDFVLSRQQLTGTPSVWSDVVPNTVSASRGAEQGGNAYKGFQSAFVNEESAPNPNYKASQMNTSYYRMKENATVQANLAAELVSGAVITVRLYADAATTVQLTKANGSLIETIHLSADAEREYTYSGSALVGESAFIIKASDNHAGIASVVVTRTYAASPSDPVLAWDTDLTGGVTQSVSSGAFQHQATSSEGSLGAIHYASSNPAVATVAADGTVSPLTEGTTTITATIEANGCYDEAFIHYDVTLTEATLAELIEATSEGGTLTLTGNYNEDAVIDKAITINAQGHSIRDLTIEQSGDLTLSSELTVRDFTICAKAGNTSIQAASGQVRNATDLTVNGNAYFLYTVDPSGQVQYGWYDFTVPFPVNAGSGIKGIQGGILKENFANGTDYAVMEYLGDKQAQGQYPYKKFSGVMQPNRLYSVTLDDDYNYNTLLMQKTADGTLVTGNSVTLNAYAGDAQHQNWNGIGNGTLHHADAGNLSVGYIQVYQSGDKNFLPVSTSDYSFVVGSAFMVQQSGTMVLNQATHSQLLAPARQTSSPCSAFSIQIAREGQPFSDQLFISASETGGQAYTSGVDVAKAGTLGSANVPQIWTNAYNTSLCVHEAQLIDGEAQYDLSLYAPAAGTYTLTSQNLPADYTLYLTQNGTTIGELNGTYTLNLNKGITTEYGLLLVEIYKTPTGLENGGLINGEMVKGVQKIMRNGVLYILQNGKVYNAQGGLMK